MELAPLDIALIVLVLAGVWAVIEIALTVRKARSAVDDISKQASETMDNLQPSITKLDGVMDELGPAAKELEPLLKKTQTTVDAASLDLMHIDDILVDVGQVTNTGASVADAVTGAVGQVASAASGAVSKITGKAPKQEAKLEEGTAPADALPSDHVEGDEGYFTYPSSSAAAATDEDAPAPEKVEDAKGTDTTTTPDAAADASDHDQD